MCVGCGPHFDYGQVKGTVTLDRVPVEGALVYFFPIIKGEGPVPPSSSAMTDAAGNYELKTQTDVPGAVVGPYSVIVKYPTIGGPEPKRPKIPVEYTLLAKTPLTIEVKPGSGDYPIAIKSKSK